MNTLYFVVCPEQHSINVNHKYVSHPNLADATAEALRLSKKHKDRDFVVMEAKPLGKVVNGAMKELSNG